MKAFVGVAIVIALMYLAGVLTGLALNKAPRSYEQRMVQPSKVMT